jgi:phosphoglycolate phosphatase
LAQRGSFNAARAVCGLRALADDEVDAFIGPPLAVGFTQALASAGAPATLVDRCIEAYRDDYFQCCVEGATVYPGVRELLADLAHKMRLAVVTSKPWEFAELILRGLELLNCFSDVTAPKLEKAFESKDATLGRALVALGVARERGSVVVVGDRRHDILAAQQHGLRSVGALWGYGSRDELRAAGADALAESPAVLGSVLATVLR